MNKQYAFFLYHTSMSLEDIKGLNKVDKQLLAKFIQEEDSQYYKFWIKQLKQLSGTIQKKGSFNMNPFLY